MAAITMIAAPGTTHVAVRLGAGTISARRAAASSGLERCCNGLAIDAVTRNRRASSSIPFSRCVPVLWNVIPAPRRCLRTEAGTRTSPGLHRHHPSGGVHGETARLAALELELAERDAGPDVDAERTDSLRDRDGASDRVDRTVERREEAVAGRVVLATTEPTQFPADELMVAADQLGPSTIPQLGRDRRRADDVREQDRSETTPGGRRSPLHVAVPLSRRERG